MAAGYNFMTGCIDEGDIRCGSLSKGATVIMEGLGEKSLCRVISVNLPFIMSKFLVQVFIMGKVRTKDFPPEWSLMLKCLGKKTKWVGIKAKAFILFAFGFDFEPLIRKKTLVLMTLKQAGQRLCFFHERRCEMI